MTRGQPDWGAYAAKKTVGSLSDMAELAVRLGSVVTRDRRGDVIWIEDFEDGMTNWTLIKSTTETATRVTDEALSKAYSVRLLGTTQPTTLAGIVRENPPPVYSRIGTEFAFLPDANAQDVRIDVVLWDGTLRYNAYVYVSIDAETITYYDSGSNWVTLASSVKLKADGKCWHIMKLVTDLDDLEYVRLILDDVEYSMADLGLASASSALAPMLEQSIKSLAALPAVAPTVYIDNVILTQNEP